MVEAVWLIPALPLAGFLTILLFGRRLGEPMAGWVATAAMGGSFLATVVTFFGLQSREHDDRFHVETIFTWIQSGSFTIDIGFLADPLSIAMCLFITGVATLIHLYSIGYMHGDPNFSKFFLYLNLFAASMLVLVLGDNLLLTFLGWEGVGACSYFLISFWFQNPANAGAGKKAFVTNRVGDFGFMLATFLVFHEMGSIRYTDVLSGAPDLSPGVGAAIVMLFLLAAAGKSAQFPLYVWLPDAMAGPTPVSALIHTATMVTSGVYLLTRLNPVIAAADGWVGPVIAWVGALTALLGALSALAQTDIKKVLAYSTVSQLGYLFLAVGSGAYVPAIFHMITHAFFKALLFLGSGSVIHGVHDEQDMRRMGGLAKFMPITAGTFIIGWLAIAGVPPFSGFWSKDEILIYAWEESPLLWFVGLVTALLTAFYMTRQVILTFFGRTRFFDATQEEIDQAWDNPSAGAADQLTAARADLDKVAEGVAKAQADVDKCTAAIAEAETSLTEAQAAVAAATEGDDGYDKLVKAVTKAEKAVPKATEALAKAQVKLDEANEGVSAAEAAVAEAETKVSSLTGARLSGTSVPTVVTAKTEAVDISELVADLPESYAHRQSHPPHESPWTMTVPLVVLSVAAVVAGGLNLPFTKGLHFLEHWLEPSLFGNEHHLEASGPQKWLFAIIAVAVGLVAIVTAFGIYLQRRTDPTEFEQGIAPVASALDDAYANFMGGPGRKLFELLTWFDRTIVDGAVNGVADTVKSLGTATGRTVQTGFVRQYALLIGFGSILVMAWFLGRILL